MMREKLKKLAPDFFIGWYKSIRYFGITLLFSIFRLIPIKKNRIVLMNVWGFGDNAKYVCLQLYKMSKELQLCYICNHPEHAKIPKRILRKKTNTIGAIYMLSTARVWIGSNRMEPYIKKRKNQYYVQLWHGGLALKKIEGDCEEYLGADYIKNAKRDSAMTDLYVSNGEFCTKMYRRAFWYQGEILECGSPRMDLLLNCDEKFSQKIKEKLGLTKECRLAIYAPTYHEGADLSVYALDYEKVTQALGERFGGKFKMLVRLHPLVRQLSDSLDLSDAVIDAGAFDDLYELMAAADVLITDYSNTMFEFAQMRKPVFLFAKDRIIYEKNRGMYFSYDCLPFSQASDNETLVKHILSYKKEVQDERTKKFLLNVGLCESGNASTIVSEKIIKMLK